VRFHPKKRQKPSKTPLTVDYRGIFCQKKYAVKEPDPETGLYYYGARYLDPKTSRWLSGDPALGDYLPSAPLGEDEKKRNGNLPGQGGVFNYVNLHVYHYAGNNPVKLVDPDGRNWYEINGIVLWDKNVTSRSNTPEGGKYIGTKYNGLSIKYYNAHSISGRGAEIKVGYKAGKKGVVDARWIQAVWTNDPLGGATSPYNDPQPPDDDKPFYWTDAELPSYKNRERQNLLFLDRSTRGSKNGIQWEGELTLVVNGIEGYEPVVTIRWGFEIKNGRAVLTPIRVSTPSDFQIKTIKDYNAIINQ
jgi:RHS repeat-associated protein